MSLLLLDIGNSRVKWALADAGSWLNRGALVHGGDPAASLVQITAQIAERPSAVWVSNVAGKAVATAVEAAVTAAFGVQASFAKVVVEHAGMRIAYAQPQRLGVDRWLVMQAIWRELQEAFIVVSAGTALTFDVVDASGQHLGGVIAAGLHVQQSAVLGATRFAAAGVDVTYTDGLGTDTEACVRQGAVHACAGLIDRLAKRYGDNGTRAILTGGDATILAPHLSRSWTQRADLVLDGLLALALESP